MIIIRFGFRGCQYTWYVHENWAMFISFLLSTILGLTVKKFINSYSEKKKIKMANPKGGIDQCMDPDSVYEVLDPVLEVVIRRMLKVPMVGVTEIISPEVLIMSYAVATQAIKSLTILGFAVTVDRCKELGVKIILGVICSLAVVFNPIGFGLVSLTGGIVTLALVANLTMGDLNCQNLLAKLPSEEIIRTLPGGEQELRHISYLQAPPQRASKLLVKGSEELELYTPISSKCDSEVKTDFLLVPGVEGPTLFGVSNAKTSVEKTEVIERKCNQRYGPLKSRTKTLADLKREDTTENKEKAEPGIRRYQKRRNSYEQRYRMRREAIRNNRIRNDDNDL